MEIGFGQYTHSIVKANVPSEQSIAKTGAKDVLKKPIAPTHPWWSSDELEKGCEEVHFGSAVCAN